MEELMARPYRVVVYWDETYWAAEIPDLPGCVTGADGWTELLAQIEDAKRAWFESMIEDGKPIAPPTFMVAEATYP